MTILSLLSQLYLVETTETMNNIIDSIEFYILVVYDPIGFKMGSCQRDIEETEDAYKFRALTFYNSFSN